MDITNIIVTIIFIDIKKYLNQHPYIDLLIEKFLDAPRNVVLPIQISNLNFRNTPENVEIVRPKFIEAIIENISHEYFFSIIEELQEKFKPDLNEELSELELEDDDYLRKLSTLN